MSAVRTGRKRAREFKLGGQRAQQVQQARVNAVAAQFDKLAPALRTPALAALHGRCTGSEKAMLARLYYREQIAAAGARGAEALNKERAILAMECIRMLWQGAESAEITTALSDLLQQFCSGERAAATSDEAHGLQLPAATMILHPLLQKPVTERHGTKPSLRRTKVLSPLSFTQSARPLQSPTSSNMLPMAFIMASSFTGSSQTS